MEETQITNKPNHGLKDVLMLAGIVGIVVVSIAVYKWSGSFYPTRNMTVSAEGKTVVQPDIATISFSVVSDGVDPEKLQMDNDKKMADAISFVKREGVDAKDIKTTSYNLSPRYEYSEAQRKSFISGYTLNQTVTVKIRDLKKVAKIVGGLSEYGVNQVSSISFGVDDPEKYLVEAREKAFREVKTKAEEMARLSGSKIVGIVSVYEYRDFPGPYYAEGMGGDALAKAPRLSPIEPGSQDITVQVNITYEIK